MSLKKQSVRKRSLCGIAPVSHQKTLKPVVFCDFDGPIVDVSERYYRTYRDGLTAIEQQYLHESGIQLQLQPLSKQRFWDMKQNRVADIEIATRSGLPEDLFPAFMQQVERIVNHPSLLRWDSIQPTARAAMEHVKQCGFRFVLVTLRHPRQVENFLQAQGIAHLVDEVYGAADVNAAHANRVEQKCELLERAIAQQKALGHFTHDSWMIGDTEADVIAGQTFGLSTAALSCGVRSENYLQHLSPSQIYDSLLGAARDLISTAVLQVA